MTLAVYISIYAGILIFVAGSVARAVRYARLPIHLRWELYPVPHEEPRLAWHGGSNFEVSDWWTKPRRPSLMGELRATLPEIAFLRALWESNRGLWYASFLFHMGMYLTVATALLVASSAASSALAARLHTLYNVTGGAAVGFTLMGAVALLVRRFADPELKNYTSAADLFNLHFFILAYGLVAAGYLVRPENSASAIEIVRGLLAFDTSLAIGRGFGAGLILASILVAYIPFTHMAHFIAKYFTYHLVRWDDRPNLRGRAMESEMARRLALSPTWSAAHIGADGQKTWAELASSAPGGMNSAATEVRR